MENFITRFAISVLNHLLTVFSNHTTTLRVIVSLCFINRLLPKICCNDKSASWCVLANIAVTLMVYFVPLTEICKEIAFTKPCGSKTPARNLVLRFIHTQANNQKYF